MDVLIVDDDADVRKSHAKALESAGFMVTAVENGLAAFVEVQETAYRAIICDIRMPFLEGRNFFEELRHLYPEMAKRVVFVTGLASDDSVRRFLGKTGQPVLQKPVEIEELVDTVRAMIGRSR
jgi:two-component system NtrC family sensor kinase